MIDYRTTLLSQYYNSPAINSLIDSFNKRVDPRGDFALFISEVWDIRTAGTWGLDYVWGPILGISRTITLDDGTLYVLNDEQFRTLLFIKASANITDCSIPNINRLLQWFFEGDGVPYILEVDTMYIRYVYPFPLQPWQVVLLRQESVIPRPAGVGFEILNYDPEYTFGFYVEGIPDAEQPWKPFNQGSFADIAYGY